MIGPHEFVLGNSKSGQHFDSLLTSHSAPLSLSTWNIARILTLIKRPQILVDFDFTFLGLLHFYTAIYSDFFLRTFLLKA